MKGIFLQRPLEFNLHVHGEAWRQGDDIQGELLIKSHASEERKLESVGVRLAIGKLKKVWKKEPDAFDALNFHVSLPVTTLVSGEAKKLIWNFPGDRNLPVTDGSTSLFILYGGGVDASQQGQLQIKVQLQAHLEEFLKILEIQFRFVKKSQRTNSKGWLDTKFDPPSGRAFATVELLTVSSRFENEDLHVDFGFQVKAISASAAAISAKKEKRGFQRVLSKSDYVTSSGRPNHEFLESLLREVVDLVESKVSY